MRRDEILKTAGELQIHPKKETMGDVVSAHMARSRYRGRGDHDKK